MKKRREGVFVVAEQLVDGYEFNLGNRTYRRDCDATGVARDLAEKTGLTHAVFELRGRYTKKNSQALFIRKARELFGMKLSELSEVCSIPTRRLKRLEIDANMPITPMELKTLTAVFWPDWEKGVECPPTLKRVLKDKKD
jgi:hypothetical protein